MLYTASGERIAYTPPTSNANADPVVYDHGAVGISRDTGGSSEWQGSEARAGDPAIAGPPILDRCSTTSHRDGRKAARLYARLSELEYYHPALLRCCCFITLTCAENETAEAVHKAWHRVQAWLMRHGYQYYLVTSPVQEKREARYGVRVLHIHVVVLGHQRVPAAAVRAVWGLGATFHETKNGRAAVRYAAGYSNAHQGGGARLSWSYRLLALLPAGARPHASVLRYVGPSEGFPGGVVDVPWGHYDVPGHPSVVYVPSQRRFLPREAAPNHSLLWACYRLTIDWEAYRGVMRRHVQDENDFIRAFRAAGFSSGPHSRSVTMWTPNERSEAGGSA